MRSSFKDKIKKNAPGFVSAARALRNSFAARAYRLSHSGKDKFECPLCGYHGPFADYETECGPIEHTRCPLCDTFERHRLQKLVFDLLASQYEFSSMSILHFAPEQRLSAYFRKGFRIHHTADIAEAGVDLEVDICDLPFGDASYDVVLASHVLEHVVDDERAISEVRRVVRPGGFAVLPVPVVVASTIEYPRANLNEFGHVRAVGTDYFDRYKAHFSRVEIWDSTQFEERYQLYTYEDRSFFPTPKAPLRTPLDGARHLDYVPVCYP